MTTNELIKKIFLKLGRYKFIVFAGALIFAFLFFLYAKNSRPVYSSRASVFPLTSSSDNSSANSALSSILGINDAPKSFSQEASINIVELALSRSTREVVAMERLPQFGNRRVAELLIENYNNTKPFYASSIKTSADETIVAAIGGDLLKGGMLAKINKNGILELNYSNTSKEIVSPVSYIFIDKISEFYKELKIKKAKLDYEFTIRKIDSLDMVLDSFDRKAIRMSNTTMFVPSERIEYSIPKENLSSQKDWVSRQREASANNREEALWRLQKVTPIIATLDKPDPPFDVKKPSSVLYGIIGLFLGFILTAFILVAGLIYKYVKSELYNAIFGTSSAAS